MPNWTHLKSSAILSRVQLSRESLLFPFLFIMLQFLLFKSSLLDDAKLLATGGVPEVPVIQTQVAEVAASLPPETTVRLDPPILRDRLSWQRLSEILYPIRISPEAPFLIRAEGSSFRVQPMPEARIPATPSPWPVLVGAPLLAALAIGAGCLFFDGWETSLIAFAVFLGVAFEAATALRAPLRFAAPVWIAVAGSAVFLRRRDWSRIRPGIPGAIGLVVVALLEFRQWAFPFTLWDARSIWMFRAKELFHEGLYSFADAHNPAYAWGHPEYPLLLPGWMAYFNLASGAAFREVAAALSLPFLYVGTCLVCGRQLSLRFGARNGWILAAIFAMGLAPMSLGGLADGFLSLFLLGTYLALRNGEERIGWLLAAAAALTKMEGLVLLLPIVLLAKPSRRSLILFMPLAGLVILHASWAGGFPTDFRGATLPSIAEIERRLPLIADLAWPYVLGTDIVFMGAVSLFCALPFLRGRPPASWWLALYGVAFVLAAYLLTPLDLTWHVQTTADRITVHGAVFGLIAFAEVLRPMRESRAG